jgi:hypothetical protein
VECGVCSGIRDLQEALEAGGRVFGALALVAMGEQHHQPGLPEPLLLARGHELVDDHLAPRRRIVNAWHLANVCYVCHLITVCYACHSINLLCLSSDQLLVCSAFH